MSLQRLEVTPFPVVLGDVITSRMTGTLVIAHQGQRTAIDWVNGELALIRPAEPGRSLGAWLFHKGFVDEATGRSLAAIDPADIVSRFHQLGAFDAAQRNAHLREWTRVLLTPLFSLGEGTAAFEEGDPLDPDRRVFFQSPAPLIIDGVRAIKQGLVIRASLGDMGRVLEPDPDPWWPVEELPLTEKEREIARSLDAPASIQEILQRWPSDQGTAARVVIALTTLGTWTTGQRSTNTEAGPAVAPADDSERYLMIMAQVGAADTRSLNAIKFNRRIQTLDLYEILGLPRNAQASLLSQRAQQLVTEYEPSSYPPAVRPLAEEIVTAVERARAILTHPGKRREYDQLLAQGRGDRIALDQYVARRSIAINNLERARELSLRNDFYGAIVLLRQSVRFDPGNAEAWHLLGSCQERNPKWRREAAVSFQKALAADPAYTEAMISLGDLYRTEGLPERARNFYQDVLSLEPDNAIAKSRLQKL